MPRPKRKLQIMNAATMPGAIVAGVASGVICTMLISGLRYLIG
ncbi:hypothetical protein [Streptomyces sp. NPDC051001]